MGPDFPFPWGEPLRGPQHPFQTGVVVRTLSILKALCFKEDEGKCQFFSLAPWHRGKCVHSMGGGRLGDGRGGSGGVGGVEG